MTSNRATFRLEVTPSVVPDARRFAAHWLDSAGALQAASDMAILLISELVTNVQLHARTAGLLTLVQEGPCVMVSVTDGSPARPRARRHGPHESTGRGIRLLDAAEEWGIEASAAIAPAGKSIWFTLALRPSPTQIQAQERKVSSTFTSTCQAVGEG